MMNTTGRAMAIAVLAASVGTAHGETAEINGSDMYYETVGDGPPILMMHGGLGLSHDYLRPYFDTLSDTHTVIYYDHFGNGRSGRPDEYSEMTFDRLVSDAAGLMDHLGHEKFTLIGHSYGGFIAQDFATQNADRLEGLVLIDTVPAFDYAPTISGPDEQMAAFGKLFSQPMADNDDWRSTWGEVVKLYFKQYPEDTGADLDDRTVYEYQAWNAAGPLLGTFNMLDKLPDVTVPTLAMAGQHDGITPPGPGAEKIGALMPNATVVVFEKSAHYPFIEEQDAFFASLNEWLNR
ncbi:alpha/beta fold hydrolase [Ruegeria conchae]|nr:alpha/beta hydrolase [Ruegeria conchae]